MRQGLIPRGSWFIFVLLLITCGGCQPSAPPPANAADKEEARQQYLETHRREMEEG